MLMHKSPGPGCVSPLYLYKCSERTDGIAREGERSDVPATVGSLKHPWSSPKKLPVSMLPKVESRPEFAQDHKSGLKSDRGPVVLCDFSKL
jgi:hypothetical protein